MFQREWLSDPEFSLWISGLPEEDFAYCKLCNKEISVYNGKSALRSHRKGLKHTELEEKERRSRLQTSKTLSKRSSSGLSARSQSHGSSSTTGLNVCINNWPCSSDSSRVHKNVSSGSRSKTYNPSSSHAPFPSTSGEHSSRHRPRERSPSPRRFTSQPEIQLEDVNRHRSQFGDNIDGMFTQHDSVIKNDCSDFLEMYKECAKYSVIASSSQFDRYSSVKNVLEEYMSQHKNLRNKIKMKLLNALK